MSDLLEVEGSEAMVEPTLPMPGAVLRAAREAHGYSLAEISQALKFSVRQLEALESDDYSTLKGATFIRGFVRSYARYMRLDEGPLLAALEPQAPVAVAEVHAVEHMNAEMPNSGQDGSKRVYWMAVAVLVLGGVAWFALQEKNARMPTTAVDSTPAVVGSEQPASVEPKAPVKAETAANSAPVQSAVAPAPTVVAPATPVAPVEATTAAAPAVTDAPTANPAERQLAFNFAAVSWVEVRDANNRILYSGNSTPDSRQVLRGRPPFQLVIGNAQSVKLRYEDRSIDLQPYTRVDVARLTLDDNTK